MAREPVDARRTAPYVASVNILLLLSALLSALTGSAVGGRAEAPRAVCAGVIAQTTAGKVAQTATARPVQTLPRVTALLVAAVPVMAIVSDLPLYASRRRE